MMRLDLSIDTLFFLEEEVADLIKEIFKSAGWSRIEFDEILIRKNELRLYIDEYYFRMWKENGEWKAWVFDRKTDKETEINVNTRGYISILEHLLNKE